MQRWHSTGSEEHDREGFPLPIQSGAFWQEFCCEIDQLVAPVHKMSSHPSHLRLALAQTCPIHAPIAEIAPRQAPFDTLERNLIHVRDQIESAASQHAEIVVFPEYFLQGLVNAGRQVSQTVSKEQKQTVGLASRS